MQKKIFAMLAAALVCVACGGGGGEGEGEGEPTGDATNGASIYEANCAVCHGADGTGASGNPSIVGADDEADIIDIVTNGNGGMPAFGETLSEQEIADVAAFVLTL